MATISRLEAFSGRPCKFNKLLVYSPTVNDILDVGEETYYYHLIFTSFNKEKILLELFNLDKEKYENVKDENDYDVLVSHPSIVQYICDSFSFFLRKNVTFSSGNNSFISEEQTVCSRDDYEKLSFVINQLNGAEKEKKKKTNFSSSKAKELLEKRNEMLKKINKDSDDGLDLKDILSILCVADGNGINIFNVLDLTIYQVYEHLERMSLKESFDRLLPVWANGHLGEKEKLPEWIKKTKL
jgi:hypothetical protein